MVALARRLPSAVLNAGFKFHSCLSLPSVSAARRGKRDRVVGGAYSCWFDRGSGSRDASRDFIVGVRTHSATLRSENGPAILTKHPVHPEGIILQSFGTSVLSASADRASRLAFCLPLGHSCLPP